MDVQFDKEYANLPVVNANLLVDPNFDQSDWFSQGYSIAILKRSTKGFTIVLNKPAEQNVTLSWIAVSVKNQKTFRGTIPVATDSAKLK